ncbi:MAG: hypothetical protein Kow0029_09690 [Candidatus Rifleibacteriota bacterium]
MANLKDFFGKQLVVINVGIPSFAQDLKKQGVVCVHVDWRPPAGGNRKIQALLEKVSKWQEKVRAAKEAK